MLKTRLELIDQIDNRFIDNKLTHIILKRSNFHCVLMVSIYQAKYNKNATFEILAVVEQDIE